MKRRKHLWTWPGILCLALFLGPPGVRGADFVDRGGLLAEDRRVEVWAEKLTRQQDRDVTVAEGAVDIRSGRVRLRADKVELNDATMDLTATGHVILEAGQDRLQGEYMEFNLKTEVGYVLDGQGFSQAYYFTGKRIDKLPEDRYLVKSGTLTSCEGVVPDWSFHSPRTMIHVDHYIYTSHPSMWVKKVPVFYVPYAILPIKPDRATGFLVPRLRYGETDGFIAENSFFWAPVDNADATFSFDYFSRRGWRYGLEGNYILAEETSGNLQASYIRDRLTRSNRWEIDYLHKQALPWSLRALAKLDYLSDRTYDRDYGIHLEDIGEEKLDSYASLTREWSSGAVILSGEHQESLVSAAKSTLTRAPELNFKQVEKRIARSPFFWSGTAQGVGLRLERGGTVTRTTRFDAAPRVSLPVNIQSWATVKPSVGAEYTYYTRDREDEAADRFLYNPRLELTGPKLYRIFGAEETLPRFKHLVTPKVTYNYRPQVNQENLLRFDSVDRISGDNSVTWQLTNQVLGKFEVEAPKKEKEGREGGKRRKRAAEDVEEADEAGEEDEEDEQDAGEEETVGAAAPAGQGGEPGAAVTGETAAQPVTEIREVFKLDLSQKYDLDPQEQAGEQKWGDLVARLTSSPFRSLSLETQADYNVEKGDLDALNYGFWWTPGNRFNLSMERRYSRSSRIDYLEGTVGVKPGRWSLTYRGRYDLRDDSFVENYAELGYKAQCWDALFAFVRRENGDEYRFVLNLKEIGTILKF